MVLCDLERGPVLFHDGSRVQEKQRSLNPKKFLSLSLSLFRHKDGGEEATADCVRGCKGAQG
jgi:hypothetical protein